MRKISLFAVVLLLTLTLPTVTFAGGWLFPTVTFTGDIVVKEGSAILGAWGNKKKTIIEWEPINLTFQDRGAREGSDWYEAGHDWNYFEDLSENWLPYYENYFGMMYLGVFRNNGEAMIKYYFGRITSGDYKGMFRYRLAGSGEWSNADGIIRCVEESFTIYEISYKAKGKKGFKTTFDPRWTGLLSFTIEIEG